MAQRAGYINKTGNQFVNWENNEFPLVCDFCLGNEELVKMTKTP